MQRRIWIYLAVGVGAGLLLGILWGVFNRQETVAPTTNENTNQVSNTNTANTNTAAQATQEFTTADLPDREPAFSFSAKIPVGWVAEYVSASQSINLYDPGAAGETSLEKSQIFVRYFEASQFETLTTVEVKSRADLTVAGRPAVRYVIEKKSGIADFSDQPAWRSREHRVTDVRRTDASPTIFYVFAQSPTLPQTTFDAFLASLVF